jgi:hypothetical protein
MSHNGEGDTVYHEILSSLTSSIIGIIFPRLTSFSLVAITVKRDAAQAFDQQWFETSNSQSRWGDLLRSTRR